MNNTIPVDPLTFLDGKCLLHLPSFLHPCFKVNVVSNNRFKTYENQLHQWIRTHIKGRYWIGYNSELIDNVIVNFYAIAFEDPKESIIFLLKCPILEVITNTV
jgi:hypothetical protein